MSLRNQGILLLGAVGLLVCGVVFQRGKARPIAEIPASVRTGTFSASLDVGGPSGSDDLDPAFSFLYEVRRWRLQSRRS